MSVRDKVMDVAALVAVCCLVILLITRLGREDQSPATEEPAPLADEPVDNWETIIGGGHQLGDASAPVTIAVFADFECPACRAFALGPERTIREDYPTDVRFVVRHLPLSYHRLALHAAKAAVCAGEQGKFPRIYQLLFDKQDSLGLKSFESFATESGVEDTWAFSECLSSDQVTSRISGDVDIADQAGARGTPTVIVNGLRLSRPPSSDELRLLVERVIGGMPGQEGVR